MPLAFPVILSLLARQLNWVLHIASQALLVHLPRVMWWADQPDGVVA